MTSPTQFVLSVAVVALCVSGCGVGPESLQTLQSITRAPSAIPTTAVTEIKSTPVKASFDPPYPERIDPFSFPDDSVLQGPGIDTSIKSAANVVVVGFADLGSPRVFLRARDKTHSLIEGESIYGVEVLEIRPPAVRLRMGSLMWTATMFDKHSADRH